MFFTRTLDSLSLSSACTCACIKSIVTSKGLSSSSENSTRLSFWRYYNTQLGKEIRETGWSDDVKLIRQQETHVMVMIHEDISCRSPFEVNGCLPKSISTCLVTIAGKVGMGGKFWLGNPCILLSELQSLLMTVNLQNTAEESFQSAPSFWHPLLWTLHGLFSTCSPMRQAICKIISLHVLGMRGIFWHTAWPSFKSPLEVLFTDSSSSPQWYKTIWTQLLGLAPKWCSDSVYAVKSQAYQWNEPTRICLFKFWLPEVFFHD